MYAACSRRLAMPTSIVPPTSTKCVGCGEPPIATRRTPGHGSPASVKIQRLPASRAASSAARPTWRWSAMLNDGPPHVSVWFIDTTQVGPDAADRRGQVAPQREAVLDHAVDVTLEEVDGLDADHRGAGALLALAERAGLVGGHAVDAGLAAGDQQVRDVLARRGPARDRGGGAVLEVVGVGDDAERALPVVGERPCHVGLEGLGCAERPRGRAPRSARAGACRSRGRTPAGPTRRRTARRARTPRGRGAGRARRGRRRGGRSSDDPGSPGAPGSSSARRRSRRAAGSRPRCAGGWAR